MANGIYQRHLKLLPIFDPYQRGDQEQKSCKPCVHLVHNEDGRVSKLSYKHLFVFQIIFVVLNPKNPCRDDVGPFMGNASRMTGSHSPSFMYEIRVKVTHLMGHHS